MNEQKNLLLAIVASLAILMTFQVLFPSKENTNPSSNFTTDSKKLNTLDENKLSVIKNRNEILSETKRLYFSEESRILGSISLKGARIDDVILKDYKETIDENSKNITLLSPKNTKNPYFAEFGWMSSDNLNIPNSSTLWTKVKGSEIGPNKPLVLEWNSPDGLIFTKTISLDTNYMFNIKLQIKNNSNSIFNFYPYGRLNRTGTPETSGFYILHEGPIGVLNSRLKEIDYDDLLEEKNERIISNGGWLGITDKYWLAAIIPDQDKAIEARFSASVSNMERYQVDFTGPIFEVEPNKTSTYSTNFFIGAKEVNLLDEYGKTLNLEMFDRAVDFGWFYIITKPLFQILHWLSVNIGNVGLSILTLTVGIRAAMFPLANKSFKAMSKMKLLSPKMNEIRKRYKDDKLKLQQEVMQLYKTEKVNPLSGCFPILIQIPIFFALYKVLFVTLETRHQPFFGWIQDLSAPDPTTIFNFFGLFNYSLPTFLMIGAWPIMMALTMYLQQKLNPAPPDPLQAKIMSFLPIIFLFLFATFPAGLVIYWTWNNILSIAQQWLIMKRTTKLAK